MEPSDEEFMREALAEAEGAGKDDEVPVGAVVVLDGGVIARRSRSAGLRESEDERFEWCGPRMVACLDYDCQQHNTIVAAPCPDMREQFVGRAGISEARGTMTTPARATPRLRAASHGCLPAWTPPWMPCRRIRCSRKPWVHC